MPPRRMATPTPPTEPTLRKAPIRRGRTKPRRLPSRRRGPDGIEPRIAVRSTAPAYNRCNKTPSHRCAASPASGRPSPGNPDRRNRSTAYRAFPAAPTLHAAPTGSPRGWRRSHAGSDRHRHHTAGTPAPRSGACAETGPRRRDRPSDPCAGRSEIPEPWSRSRPPPSLARGNRRSDAHGFPNSGKHAPSRG